MEHLPDWMANVTSQVDGVVALDDGSIDGSREYLQAHPSVVEVLTVPRDRAAWDEVENHRALVMAGVRHRADWLVVVDADERLEHGFRDRAERVIRRVRRLGLDAFRVRLRELWDRPDQWRADGIWGRKTRARLFRALPDHRFDTRPMHAVKAPLQGLRFRQFPVADVEIYHLGMLTAADRAARRARYEDADPDAKWQPGVGYAYLTDETGLRLAPVKPDRDYR